MRVIDRLVGTWKVTGGAEGTVRYEWMPGRYFLLQHVDPNQFGEPVTGIEVIGNLRPFGEPAGEDVMSRHRDRRPLRRPVLTDQYRNGTPLSRVGDSGVLVSQACW